MFVSIPDDTKSPMTTPDRQVEIRRFYDRYLDAFHTGNAAAVAPFYRAPCLFIADQGVTLLETDAEIERLFGQVIAGLRERNYARSEVRDVQIKELSDRLALFSGLAVRYTAPGEELERLSATYTLRKSDDTGWQIVTVVAHGPDTLVRFT